MAVMTSRYCEPSHKLFVPGSPSPLRPRKPPSVATIRMASRSEGGWAGFSRSFWVIAQLRLVGPPSVEVRCDLPRKRIRISAVSDERDDPQALRTPSLRETRLRYGNVPTVNPVLAMRAEAALFLREKAKSLSTPERVRHMRTFPIFEIGLGTRDRKGWLRLAL
jgi:hypothetical protein